MMDVIISFIFPTIYIFLYLYCRAKNHSVASIIFISFIFIPSIKIGSKEVSMLYIWILLYGLDIFSHKKPLLIKKNIFRYCRYTLGLMTIYFFAWLLINPHKSVSAILLQAIKDLKFIILAVESSIILFNETKKELLTAFKKSITLVIYANTVCLLMQIVIPLPIATFLNKTMGHALFYEQVIHYGFYPRYPGILGYVAINGLLSLLAIAVLLPDYRKNETGNLAIFAAIFCGIVSMSKTFYAGFFILIYFWLTIAMTSQGKKMPQKLAITLYCILTILLLFIINYNYICRIMLRINPFIAYYMKQITHLDLLLDNRFGEKNGALISLVNLAKENILFGVGPLSVNGEMIVDNAYLVLLHNGGIMALITVLCFYFRYFRIAFRFNNQRIMLILLCLFATGMGYATLWYCEITFSWVLFILLWVDAPIGKSEEIKTRPRTVTMNHESVILPHI